MDKLFKTIGTIGNITILECTRNAPFEDAKFTYQIDGDNSSRYYYESADTAFLGALGKKYLGLNSQFAEFAQKMLKDFNKFNDEQKTK
jgi:hypothetical protein